VLAGATVGGSGTLRNLAGSTLILADNSQLGVALVNEGSLRLGALGAADPTVQSFAQTSAGTLQIGVFPNSNTGDKLIVTGQAALGGVLNVSRINELSLPDPSFVYTVVTGSSISGIFANAPTQGARVVADFGSFQINYSPTSVTLSNFLPRFSADFDDDGDVDGDDLIKWQGDYGPGGGSDADGDNDSDGADFLAWQRQLGSGLPSAAASATVPEPTTLPLAIVATVGIWRHRRRNTYAVPKTRRSVTLAINPPV
jgi:hypothetical protein